MGGHRHGEHSRTQTLQALAFQFGHEEEGAPYMLGATARAAKRLLGRNREFA